MIGRPSARTSGQYDGDGMWMLCGSSGRGACSGSSTASLGGQLHQPALVVLGVLAVPELVAVRRRSGSRRSCTRAAATTIDPLERARVPRVVAGASRRGAGVKIDVHEEHEHRQRDDERADRREQVERVPAHARRVRVGAAGLALEAEEVHREEREVEPDDHQPEVQLAHASR